MNGNEISDNQVEDVSEGVHTKDFEVFNPFLKSKLLILFIFSIFSENKFYQFFPQSIPGTLTSIS